LIFFVLSDGNLLGKAAILELETRSYEEGSGELLCMNRTTVFLRGAGGFSNSSQPFSYKNYPSNQGLAVKIPQRQPLTVCEERTQPSQALLYRLSGDYNPLHSDPEFAKLAGLVNHLYSFLFRHCHARSYFPSLLFSCYIATF
jgi:hypothetical protein